MRNIILATWKKMEKGMDEENHNFVLRRKTEEDSVSPDTCF
jgi:hypothetical protein